MKTGVDVSSWQHPDGAAIDYELAVRSGVDFVIAELLDEEGPTPNPFYYDDHKGFTAAGAAWGSYVFVRPNDPIGPQIEALRSCSQLGPVWADLEVNDGDDAAQVKAFWLAIREGVPTCGLATYPAFLGWADIPASEGVPLFIDEWGIPNPTVPCVVWGMTDKAEVPGIPGLVDLDAFMGSPAAYVDLFGDHKPAAVAPAVVRPCVAGAATPSGRGYWLVDGEGQIYSFGDAAYHGNAAHVNKPVVGIAATPTGRGYHLFCADYGVLSFGDARFEGAGH